MCLGAWGSARSGPGVSRSDCVFLSRRETPGPLPVRPSAASGRAYLQQRDPLDRGREARLGFVSAQQLFAHGSLRTDDRACGVRTRLSGARSDARREGLTLT